ncbi:MAG: hypothetical protein PG981_000671 [Wolbachia endosymbiont of Ctenocephalides orientis wCori]|nr:MAG: hypothetical protein PG981_000671 [Wolbachia endosymbiont of Ctenocephalides orientis wCori]
MLKKIVISFSIIFFIILSFFIFLKSKDYLEININYVDFYVKHKISKMFAASNINMKDTSIIWQNNGDDPYLAITDLVIISPDFAIEIPEFFIYFKLNLFKASAKFSQILADNVNIHVNQEEADVNLNLVNPLQAVREFFFSVNAGSKIELNNITINQNTKDESFIDKLYIGKREDFNVLNINVHAKGNTGFLNNLSVTIKNRNDLLNVYGTFHNLKVRLFSEFSALVKSYNLNKNIGFKGNFSLKINKKSELTDGNIYVLNTENHYDKNRALTNVNANLTYSDRNINIKNFNFKLNDTMLSLVGKMNLNTSHALLRMNISKFEAKDLCTYVPDGVVNDNLKKWYCENIAGDIVNTVLSFNGKVNDLINDDLSNIIVVSDIENGSVKFDDDFERVQELSGKLILKSNNLKITLNSGRFQNFTIENGNIEMNSVDKDDSVLTIHGQAVSDAYGLYEPVKFKLDDILGVTEDDINGTAKSVFKFKIFNLNADDDKEVDFLAEFRSKIEDLNIYNASIGNYDIKLNFGSNFIDLNSSGIVNNTQLSFDLKSSDDNKNFTWKLNGDLPAEILNLDKNLSGYVNANVESSISEDKTGYINGTVDLSELKSSSSYLGWKNHFEDHTKVAFSVDLKGVDNLSIEKLDVVGNNVDIQFSGRKENKILYLNSNNLKLYDNDFNINIKSNTEKIYIVIDGEKINLSDILDSLGQDSNKTTSDIEISMNVENVIMKENITIKYPKLSLTCTKGNCDGSEFTGQFLEDNSKVLAKYSGIGLEIYADNAGVFLRSIGISKSVKNGKLSFYLSSQRENEEHYGMLSIADLYIKDAPLLTTLLSMSSLPGIMNAIKNEGMHFYKFNAPFLYKNDIIEIEESWLEGADLGISTSGKIDILDYKFQVEGQVIPAYSINQSLCKIPIIGKLLTGGKSRGVISIDYKASGDDKNNNVSVNFISSLTPSLLKRVLGIFDRMMSKSKQ